MFLLKLIHFPFCKYFHLDALIFLVLQECDHFGPSYNWMTTLSRLFGQLSLKMLNCLWKSPESRLCFNQMIILTVITIGGLHLIWFWKPSSGFVFLLILTLEKLSFDSFWRLILNGLASTSLRWFECKVKGRKITENKNHRNHRK